MEGIKSVNETIPVVGCTSSAGILVPDGYMIPETGSVEILVLDDDAMEVSCYGMAKQDSARETGRQVAIRALEQSGMDFAPDYFFMSAAPGAEEDYIKGIQDVIGRVPCFGGSAADNTVEGKWSLFYNDDIFADGVTVAFIYTDKNIPTVYTGAYHETNNVGIITNVKNKRTLCTIDGVSSLKKYAEWIGSTPQDLRGDNLLAASITKPLGVKSPLGGLTVIRHPMFGDDQNTVTVEDDVMNIGNNLVENTAVIQMEASIDELIASTSMVMKELKKKCPNVGAYLLVHCGGRRLGIGDRMNEVYDNLKKEAGDVPFITVFTFGEYGYTDDEQSNATGGLMLSFTAFEK